MFLNDLRNKKQEHKEIKNAPDGEYRKGVITQLREAIDAKFNMSAVACAGV